MSGMWTSGRFWISLNEQVTDVAFAVGGRVLVVLVVSQQDHEIRFYDLFHPDRPPRCIPGKHQPQTLAVSPDGRLVVATTDGSMARLCDALTGELIEDMRGNNFGIAFSKDGRRVVSAGGGLNVWDIRTRQELLKLSSAGSILRRGVVER